MAKTGYEPKLICGPFTSLDLAVVAGIICVLAAILFPVRAQIFGAAEVAAIAPTSELDSTVYRSARWNP